MVGYYGDQYVHYQLLGGNHHKEVIFLFGIGDLPCLLESGGWEMTGSSPGNQRLFPQKWRWLKTKTNRAFNLQGLYPRMY